LAQSAFGLWRELEAVTKSRLLTMTGALMIGTPTSELVAGALRSVREHSLAHEMLGLEEMRRRYPQHRLRPGEVALHEEDAGVLRPEACVVAAATRARDLGATIRSNTTAPPLDELRSDYDHVVVCAGAWLPKLLPRLRIQVERQVMTWFEPQDGAQFTPERFPAFMRETPEGGERFGIPAVDGGLVKVGIHHEGEPTDIDHLDRSIRDEDRRRSEAFIAENLNGLMPKVVKAAVCMYSNTPDFHFLVGPAPGLANVSVLGGFSGHGFKFAPVLGEVAAGLATEGGTRYPIALFEPKRALAAAPSEII
jgi:sarcosine oxidase